MKTLMLTLVVVAGLSATAVADDGASDRTPPSEQSKFRLEFQDQPWLPALQWFADKSGLNLDWQTLPEGELNLSAQQPYTLDEIRDVLNMQLLVRGFTLLQRGEVLRVVALDQLDPTLVPRFEPDDLEQLSPHQFVRVSFPLDWIIAEDAARELAPLLSPYGKLIPLEATNHLEAMGAVVNLREINKLIDREQSQSGRKRLVEEFRLQHRRASDVASMLRQLLGLESFRSSRSSTRMQLDLERTKLQSQAVKELGQNATRFLKDEPEVNLVVNEEENSILVHAPPDKVEVIRQAVISLDRPSSNTDSAWENINRVKVYKVNDVDVDSIRDMIDEMQELGRLDQETRIEIDDRNDTIIAYATPSDHLTIAHLVRSFQQDPREAHVVQLRVLEARYAVQAVRVLFNKDEESDDWRYRRSRSSSAENAFRVEADTQHRRLLLWATAAERTRVMEYLSELGEVAVSNTPAMRQGVQVLQSGAADFSLLEAKLRDVWSSISDAPLVIQPLPNREGAPAAAPQVDPAAEHRTIPPPEEDESARPPRVRTASLLQVNRPEENADAGPQAGRPTSSQESASTNERAAGNASVSHPPVRIIEGPDGKLIVVSDDPEAARLMTELLESLLPAQQDIHVFPLKHASAFSVEFQIYDLLDLGEEAEVDALGGGQPKIVVYSDMRTNNLIVRHADAEQLKAIRNLIDVLDQPDEVQPALARQHRIYKVKHKDATQLSETVKEVYRDLLSSSDKAFDARNSGDDRRRSLGYLGFASSRSTTPDYQGLLSVGVEQASNSVIVSAPKYLIEEVMSLIESIDQQGSSQAVSVIRLRSGISSTAVKESLGEVLGE